MSTREMFAEMLLGSGFADDPYELFAEWRRDTPVREGDVMVEFGVPTLTPGGRPTFTLFRYDDVVNAFRDPETFSTRIYAELLADSPLGEGGGSLLGADGDEHRLWRGLFRTIFARNALLAWDEQVMRPVAQRCVEDFAADTKSGDLVDFAFRFPMHMIYGMMGIGSEDPGDFERFQEMALAMLLGIVILPDKEQMRLNAARSAEAGRGLLEVMVPAVARKRAEGATGEDLMSVMIRADFEGRKLTDEEIAVFVRNSLPAATENTWRQFLNTMTCLLSRPEALDAIRADRTLMRQAVIEGERFEAPVLAMPRMAVRDVELRGVTIPEGAAIVLAVGSANRDPDSFPDPDTFDIRRHGPIPLAFGLGAHACPGMPIARFEITAAVDALLDLLPNLRLDPSQEPPRVVGAPFRSPTTLPVVWD